MGGIGVALARIAIAAGIGARVELTSDAAAANAATFGERAGRVVVGVAAERASAFRRAVETTDVPVTFLGVAGGAELDMRIGGARVVASVGRLADAWGSGF